MDKEILPTHTIGIVGPPSSGKSTFANAIAGNMFTRIARKNGTVAPVAHAGRFNVIDFAGISGVNCARMDVFLTHLPTLDIIVYIDEAAKFDENQPLLKCIRKHVDERKKRGFYHLLLPVAGKYDYFDPELDEIIGDVRRICAMRMLKSVPYVAADTDSWSCRERVKAARFGGKLTDNEDSLMKLCDASDIVRVGRKCALIGYINDRGVADVKHIYSLLETTRADSDVIMTTLANKIHNFDVGVQYMYLRTFGRALGLGPEWREYLPDCHLKCAIYAAKNDRVNLAKYLFTTDTTGYLPQGLADFASPINVSMLWGISYTDLCVDAGVSGSANDIIELIADEHLRTYFNLISRSYEELLADIVAGRSQEIRKKVTAGGVNWKDFRGRLSSDYFVHNRRGTVATIVCEMLQTAGDM